VRVEPRRLHRPAPVPWAALVVALCAAPSSAAARDLWSSEDGEHRLELTLTLKNSWLLSRSPDDPVLFPERASGAGLFRLRFSLLGSFTEWITTEVAYEHRSRFESGTGAGGGVLPSGASAPYRLTPLDWNLVDHAPTFVHAHEIDRAYVALHLPFGEVTVGRQAVGLGRGVLFGAVDLFAPFSPLEVDREWRRGVDAIRADVRFGEQLSADATLAFGEHPSEGAAVWRLRGFAGPIDGALIFGRRGRDTLGGLSASATIGDSEIHGEAALFDTDGRGIDGGWLGSDRLVAKFLAGGSHAFDVGRGLRVFAEYHYSGFGLEDVAADASLVLDPDFQARYARGDTQILGRHAVAVMASYDLFDDLGATAMILVSPADGSGMFSPALTWSYSDGVSIVGSLFLPWGAGSNLGRLGSEYGSAPLSVFLQASVYD